LLSVTKLLRKCKSIRERLDEIVDEKTRFHLTDTVREKRSGFLDYGRDEDAKTIIDFLVDYAFGSEGFVCLSNCWSRQNWKNNTCPTYHQSWEGGQRLWAENWVCVSEDFSLKRMTKVIIEVASKKSRDDLDTTKSSRSTSRRKIFACIGWLVGW